MRIEILNGETEEQYENFLLRNDLTLLYYSNKYRRLLKQFLQADDYYFIALNDRDEIIGVLPTFLKLNKKYGNILNSLPFYGSNGGIIEFSHEQDLRSSLLDAFYELAEQQRCVTATLITSPFEENNDFYRKFARYTFCDERIGQLTKLPTEDEHFEEKLFDSFHAKTRNMIRKARKNDLKVLEQNTTQALYFLAEVHKKNIEAIKGVAKPKYFFELIPQIFKSSDDYKIWVAYFKDRMPVAALLLFYFNKTVEYFTPAIVAEYRQLQPLSLLIFESLKDAVQNKYVWWNWGGTWLQQTNLYRFKKRWAAVDRIYYYYTKIYKNEILSVGKEIILEEYPYFYVAPFNKLK
jgi:hypothetical protein